MIGRLAYVTLTIVLAGCYNVPQPACGFVCGPAGECPSAYTCNTEQNVCLLDGASPTLGCPSFDGSVDGEDPDAAPYLLHISPFSGETGVPQNVTIEARFSEVVYGVTSGTFVLATVEATIPASVTWDPFSQLAMLDPDPLLAQNTAYTIALAPSITDGAAQGLIGPFSWSFTTGDNTAPSIQTRSPAPGATGIGVDATVIMTFDEDVLGISGTSFTLAQGVTAVPGSVSYASGPLTATFTPAAPLAANTIYTATASSAIMDMSGYQLAGSPVTWQFTTGADTVAPTVTSTLPMAGATAVPITTTIAVLFDEPVAGATTTTFTVNGGAITGTVTTGIGGRLATFTPDASLPADALITVTLGTGIIDFAGNPLGAVVTFAFQTPP